MKNKKNKKKNISYKDKFIKEHNMLVDISIVLTDIKNKVLAIKKIKNIYKTNGWSI